MYIGGTVELLMGVHAKASDFGLKSSHQMTCDARLSDLVGLHRIRNDSAARNLADR